MALPLNGYKPGTHKPVVLLIVMEMQTFRGSSEQFFERQKNDVLYLLNEKKADQQLIPTYLYKKKFYAQGGVYFVISIFNI